jgi:pimeloyl-ACP methyl ester carboxylesterase
MPRAKSNGAEIEYETFGPPGETIILINGLGSQMNRWPEDFCERLVAQGFQVVRFDNRDVGHSSWMTEGQAYTLADMAADTAAVLDAVGAAKAHIVGISMGGMIAQVFAFTYPGRTLSLTSIMSNTGNPDLPPPPALDVLTSRPPDPATDFAAFIAYNVANARKIGSGPEYAFTDAELEARARHEYARAYNPPGVARQMTAIGAYGDRREKLKTITAPTVVLHGADDPLVPVAGGHDTAANIPGAEIRVIPGMGHDLTPRLYDTFVSAIMRAVERSRVSA